MLMMNILSIHLELFDVYYTVVEEKHFEIVLSGVTQDSMGPFFMSGSFQKVAFGSLWTETNIWISVFNCVKPSTGQLASFGYVLAVVYQTIRLTEEFRRLCEFKLNMSSSEPNKKDVCGSLC